MKTASTKDPRTVEGSLSEVIGRAIEALEDKIGFRETVVVTHQAMIDHHYDELGPIEKLIEERDEAQWRLDRTKFALSVFERWASVSACSVWPAGAGYMSIYDGDAIVNENENYFDVNGDDGSGDEAELSALNKMAAVLDCRHRNAKLETSEEVAS